MTLRKQLFAALSLLFLAVLLGLLLVNVRGTRDYLENQLASHAQDAATSLSMRLAQVMDRNDPVLTEMQVEAVFDRGYFQRVLLLDPKGGVLLEKALPLNVGQVPVWFTSQFPLSPPGGEAFVTSGWRQLGKVVVQSQPAHAYEYLWSNSRELAAWVVLVYVVALLLTHWMLTVILNPLNAIERTAKAVQEKRFEQIVLRPSARELARVVRAMNDMSRRIAEILDAEVQRAEGFRRQMMLDEVTQAENRKSFDLRFAEILDNPDVSVHGHLLGLEVNNLKAFNTDVSYRQGDDLLRRLVKESQDVLDVADAWVARLGGGAFAFVWLRMDSAHAFELAREVQGRLDRLFLDVDAEQKVSFSMGLVPFGSQDRKGDLLARLDVAIEGARLSGRNQLQLAASDNNEMDSLGSQGWRDLLEKALHEERWSLMGQTVTHLKTRKVVHVEVMGRLVDQAGESIPASRFIPMATRHRLMPAVDKAILSMVKEELIARPDLVGIAVNLSAQSVSDPQFMLWLQQYLREMGAKVHRLSLEITCYGCSQNLPAARAFAQLVRRTGAKFGIDRMGMDPLSPRVLREIPPDYIKLDSPKLMGELGVKEAHEWLAAIVSLARSLEAMVIAQGIETQEDIDNLGDLHDAGQGYFMSRPSRL